MNPIDKHLEDRKQKKDRLLDLEKSIKKNETELSRKESEYKQAVVEDNSNIDDLFKQLNTLEDKIKADKRKFSTLQVATNEHLKSDAASVIKEFPNVKEKHREKVASALDHIEKAKQAYVKELSVLDGLNENYHTDRKKFERLISMYNFNNSEVNKSLRINIEDIAGIAPYKFNNEISSEYIKKELHVQ